MHNRTHLFYFFVISILGGFIAGVVGAVVVVTHVQKPLINDTKFLSTDNSASVKSVETVDVVERASPAVVSVVVERRLAQANNQNSPFLFDNFFDDYFNSDDGLQKDDPAAPFKRVGGGSGFVISADGLILTNRHVVDDQNAKFVVVFNDGKEFEAKVLGIDQFNDIALLDIEIQNAPVIELGDSDAIKIGQTVIAIGNALGEFQNSVTKGIISGMDRRIVAGNGMSSDVIEQAIQTDAAINGGNSGGPLIDEQGKAIGINTAVSRQGQSIGFAIPINVAVQVVESYKTHGRIVRPWMGIRYVMLTPEQAKENNLEMQQGAFIVPGTKEESGIVKNSPAEKAGLQERDVIVAVDDVQLDMNHSLSSVVGRHQVGDTIALKIVRDKQSLTIAIKLEELPQTFSP